MMPQYADHLHGPAAASKSPAKAVAPALDSASAASKAPAETVTSALNRDSAAFVPRGTAVPRMVLPFVGHPHGPAMLPRYACYPGPVMVPECHQGRILLACSGGAGHPHNPWDAVDVYVQGKAEYLPVHGSLRPR